MTGVLPASVRRSVQEALAGAGSAVTVRAERPLGGGCINPSARIETSDGASFFVKWNPDAPLEMFEAEADGLAALRGEGAPNGIRVPHVVGVGGGNGNEPAWLLLEFIERGRDPADFGERLGSGLAQLHRPAQAAGFFGWTRDNFIGALEQRNPRSRSWPGFWRDARLAPQLELAISRGHFSGETARTLERLLEHTEKALARSVGEGASLLHGDLWSGNVYPGPDGEPVLIDPAVYFGDSEVDLAMSELFGGFPDGYLEAYHEARQIPEPYRRLRRPLYQLYYLLVHVNLFGGGYVGASLAAAKAVLREL